MKRCDYDNQGRIQDFDLGGAKDYVPARTLRARNRNHFPAGVQCPLKGPGSSMVALMLSLAIWALFQAYITPLKTSPEYTRAGVYGKYV